jgi:3-mercaptopyruvate sulfurtransferase SseA
MAVTPHDLIIGQVEIREISNAEAQALMTKRTIIDVREYEEFAAGHLPGAINIPRGVLEFKIGTIVRQGQALPGLAAPAVAPRCRRIIRRSATWT